MKVSVEKKQVIKKFSPKSLWQTYMKWTVSAVLYFVIMFYLDHKIIFYFLIQNTEFFSKKKYHTYSNKRPGVYYKHCLLVERGWAFIRGITCPWYARHWGWSIIGIRDLYHIVLCQYVNLGPIRGRLFTGIIKRDEILKKPKYIRKLL